MVIHLQQNSAGRYLELSTVHTMTWLLDVGNSTTTTAESACWQMQGFHEIQCFLFAARTSIVSCSCHVNYW